MPYSYPAHVCKFYSYSEYRNLIFSLTEKKSCSGEISGSHIAATVINFHRMKRVEKTTRLTEELVYLVKQIKNKQTWLLLTESWCIDSAQNIPVIAKIANLNSLINLQIIFRDENPMVIDSFLTNGARAIPKLIISEHNEVIASWGPRPTEIQEKVILLKQTQPEINHSELVKKIQLLYIQDNAVSLQRDFIILLKQYNSPKI